MSVQPEDLVAPQDTFLAESDPTVLREPNPFDIPQPPVADHPDIKKIAIAIAAALVVLRIVMKRRLEEVEPSSPKEIREAAQRTYSQIIPGWMQASVPAIAQAYRLGSTGNMSYAELEQMATDYATELGQYVNDTSIDALVEGFTAQVNGGWSERLAWQRSREAYGLDSVQMRSYVKGLMSRDKSEYITDPVPPASRAAIDRAFMIRADRMGVNEAHKATQVGKNMVWLAMQAGGQVPEGTLKMWITAEDERVCPVCAPLDQVAIPLHQRFESQGQFFYAPGVHPNCRCELQMVPPQFYDIVKNMPGDPYDRDAYGKFAVREARKTAPKVAADAFGVTTPADPFAAFGGQQSLKDAFGVNSTQDYSAFKTADPFAAFQIDPFAAFDKDAYASFDATGKTRKLYRIHVFGHGEGKVETTPLPGFKPEHHRKTAWMPADDMLEILNMQPKPDPQWNRAGLISGTVKFIDFGDLYNGSHGANVVPVHTGPDGFMNAFDENVYKAAQRAKNRVQVAQDTETTAVFSRYGHTLPQDMQAARRALAGLSTSEMSGGIVRPALSNSPELSEFFSTNYLAADQMAPNELAEAILRIALHEKRDRPNPTALMPMTEQLNMVVKNSGAEHKSVDQLLQERGQVGGYETPIFFEFQSWYGQNDHGQGELTGKYEVVGVKRKTISQQDWEDFRSHASAIYPDLVKRMKVMESVSNYYVVTLRSMN